MERVPALLFCILFLTWSVDVRVEAYKSPFVPIDVLPLLPRAVSWPVLNTLYNAVDLLPEFVGAVWAENDTVAWNGTCFLQNEAHMEYTEPKEEGHRGGGILHIEVHDIVVYDSQFLKIVLEILLSSRRYVGSSIQLLQIVIMPINL